jgi:hypothetical protein
MSRLAFAVEKLDSIKALAAAAAGTAAAGEWEYCRH